MKDNDSEKVVEKVKSETGAVIKRIQDNSKGVKPFGKKVLTPSQKMKTIEDSGYLEDPSELINEFGMEATQRFFQDYQNMKLGGFYDNATLG